MDNFDKLQDLTEDKEELELIIRKVKEDLVVTKLESLGLRIGDRVTTDGHDGFLSKVWVSRNSFKKTFSFEYRCVAVKKDGTPSMKENFRFTRYLISSLKLGQE